MTYTGVTMFELSDGVDDGPIYGQEGFQIARRERISGLISKSRDATLKLIANSIPKIASGSLRSTPQVGIPSYCLQRNPSDGLINWRDTAENIDRLVRAVGRPYSGAYSALDGRALHIWETEYSDQPFVLGAPGQIARLPERQSPVVVTGSGLLIISEATFNDGSDAIPTLLKSNNKRFG